MYRAHIISSLNEWRAIGPAWNDLADRAGIHFPAHRAETLASLATCYFDQYEWVAVLVWDNDRLVAGLPLMTRRRAMMAATAKSLANEWSPRSCLVIDPSADVSRCADAMLAGLKSAGVLFTQLDWLSLDDPQLKSLLVHWSRAGVACWVKPRFAVGRIDVPADWETFEAQWSRNRRKKLRQLERQLEQRGKVEFVEAIGGSSSTIREELERVYEMEHEGWKGEQGTSILSNERARQFFDEWTAHHAHLGSLRLYWLTVNGEPIAFDLGTLVHQVFTSYKISYLPQWAHFSPGQLLLRRQLEYFCRQKQVLWMDCVGELDDATRRWASRSFTVGKLVFSTGSWLGNHVVSWMAGVTAAKTLLS